MEVIDNEYFPSIEQENQKTCYFAIFYDIKHNLNKVEISKKVFLQMFGVHKIKKVDKKKKYFISYKDGLNICEIELTKLNFKKFNSFKSQNIKHKNIYDRYIEHLEQTDIVVQKHMIYKQECIENNVYKKLIKKEIHYALQTLNEIQRRRFIMYYLDEMTYEKIAEIEGCTKRAIKFSVDAARKNLQAELKNLYLDYTNK